MGLLPSPRQYDSQEHLAAKLAEGRPTVLAFLSPSCGLCRSLEPQLTQVSNQSEPTSCHRAAPLPRRVPQLTPITRRPQVETSGLQVARLDSSDATAWAPEMLAYRVEAVPCFVLLDSQGKQAATCPTAAATTSPLFPFPHPFIFFYSPRSCPRQVNPSSEQGSDDAIAGRAGHCCPTLTCRHFLYLTF